VMQIASDTIKPVLLELGGKNALIAFADADPVAVAEAMIAGMNFAWCGQSCGSTSRAFVHAAIHDRVLAEVKERIRAFRPGLPEDWDTTMGAIVNHAQYDRILSHIESAKKDGATLICGGGAPDAPALAGGLYIEPTVFADVTPAMTIAREEIFGPVLSVLKWSDEPSLFRDVNAVDHGLTASIWTRDLATAHRAAARVEAGYVWINQAGSHFLGAPFGGVKQSGIGRDESFDELLEFTQIKNVNVNLD